LFALTRTVLSITFYLSSVGRPADSVFVSVYANKLATQREHANKNPARRPGSVGIAKVYQSWSDAKCR